MNAAKKVAKAPIQPGVYLMKSADGKVIYVGKAKNLRNRLKSYFRKDLSHTPRTQTLVLRIHDVEWIITSTELEALMLEGTLIKKHHPRYNVHLKDDKSYPFLRISVHEKWPQISVVRRPGRDQALYFGPYTSAYSVRETLRLLTKIFPVRDCSPAKFANRSRPCLSYDIGICAAPCVNYVTEQAYRNRVSDLIRFLKGKDKALIKNLKARMKKLSQEMKYEEASRMRDRIWAIENLLEKQKVVSLRDVNQDVIGFYRWDRAVEVALLFVRAGRLLGKKAFSFPAVSEDNKQFLAAFIHQYYDQQLVPDEIIVAIAPSDKKLLETFLKEKMGQPSKIVVAQKGEKRAMIQMAAENAKEALQDKKLEESGPRVLEALKKRLALKNDPHRIECFDISNIQGAYAVGSRVTFMEGERVTRFYRRYKIRSVEGPNDTAMMYEVLFRRFKNEEKENYPDLLMVDGGKGQLSVAVRVFKELGIQGIDMMGLAKEKTISSFQGKTVHKIEERVYLPGQKNPIIFRGHSPVLHLLQRVRDEAHRFAISYHKYLRAKGFLSAEQKDK